MTPASVLEQLVELAHALGRSETRQTILAEGNVSADLGDGTFYVKASGGEMANIGAKGFTRVRTAVILGALKQEDKSDEAIQRVIAASRFNPEEKLPSIESFLHALCLEEGRAKWVGHTHALSVVRILSSKLGTAPFQKHVFPDSIVVCGRHVATVPYADPGIHLALALQKSLSSYIDQHGIPPKVILMKNHGPVALGQSKREVMNILLMLDKWASVLLGTYFMGGPDFLEDSISHRIETRLDEHHRRQELGFEVISKRSNGNTAQVRVG